MLSPEQRSALYSGTEIPRDRKRLVYRYQMLMIHKEGEEGNRKRVRRGNRTEENVKRSSLPKHLPRSKKEDRQRKMNCWKLILAPMKSRSLHSSVETCLIKRKIYISRIPETEQRHIRMDILGDAKSRYCLCHPSLSDQYRRLVK